jgi:DNA-binding Lrp family transcriptional regulator
LDSFDRNLLNILQRSFPLVSEPYTAVASALHARESDVINRIAGLKEEGVIRQISAIFSPPAVGYQTCLVAMAIDREQVEQAAQVINRERGVSHNYLRENEFNMWFTIAVPPGTDLQSEVGRLGVAAAARKTLILPAVKLYKIAVVLDMEGDNAEEEGRRISEMDEEARTFMPSLPESGDIHIIRCIQEDLPLIKKPFFAWAESLSLEEDYLINWVKSRLEKGVIRRFAALLRHRKAGFLANAMVAWECPLEIIDRQGQFLAAQPEVTHCYYRVPTSGWPYNLYAMVHDRDRASCDRVIERLITTSGLNRFKVLYSVREIKKERLKLFWEEPLNRSCKDNGK